MAHWIASVLLLVMAGGVALWTAGAIYFDVGRGARWSWALTLAWCLFVVVLFAAWQPLWRPYGMLLATTFVFVGWWLSLKPSHDRQWDESVAVLSRAVRRGDDTVAGFVIGATVDQRRFDCQWRPLQGLAAQ